MTLLPPLMPLLDGTRDHRDLMRDSDLTDAALRQVLSTLFAAGMLVDGPAAGEVDQSEAFFERMVDASRRNRSAVDARTKRESRRILVAGTGRAAEVIRSALIESGVVLVKPNGSIEEAFLCVVVDTGDAASLDVERKAREAAIPILPVRVGALESGIGPVSHHDFGPCLACIQHACAERGGTPAEGPLRVYALMVAIEVTMLISEVGRPTSEKAAIRIDPVDLSTSSHWIPRRPGCHVCGTGVELDTASELAYIYEASVEFPPSRLRNPRDHQGHFESSSVRLTYDRREFPATDRVDLTGGSESRSCAPNSPLEILGRLLQYSFGFKPAKEQKIRPRRWAPSGGNLGSQQAYLSIRNVQGIPDGEYAYVAADHSLARVASRDPGVLPASSTPSVELFIASELERVWKKYSAFAYRVTALDAGVAIAHVALMAATSGLTLRCEPGWNEAETARRFELDRSQQSISARVMIGGFA
ncbi:nitroreductase family protein [Leifsonia sp. P73]|uniref:nitroreductase family protein n=1 Tax=Leifsonia sp. P73 TaxID=3423959 RepID=UPI003DA5D616